MQVPLDSRTCANDHLLYLTTCLDRPVIYAFKMWSFSTGLSVCNAVPQIYHDDELEQALLAGSLCRIYLYEAVLMEPSIYSSVKSSFYWLFIICPDLYGVGSGDVIKCDFITKYTLLASAISGKPDRV